MTRLPETAEDIHPGQVLAGKYRVERVLGTGGMGMVVAAHHIQLDERVALKFLLPEAVASMEAVARFMREARAAFKIKSEHVARVTDVGQLEGGSPYIVMEYLDGKDLSTWLSDYGPMPVEQAVDFVLQASEAIAEAHALGIIHRDLKPANLFCVQRSDGQLSIKVLDFGISKLMNPDAQSHAMTRTNALAGSPQYMSPEHMKSSKTVDARTDIWSLGVILYELVAGDAPFDGEAVTELILKVATEPAIPLGHFRPDAPPRLQEVLDKCLQKDREKRYQTVGELAQALAELAPPHARPSIDRIVGTLQRAGVLGPVLPTLSESSSALYPAAMAAMLSAPPSVVTSSAPMEVTRIGQPLPRSTGATTSNPSLPAAIALPVASPPAPHQTVASWGESKAWTKPGNKALVGLGVGSGLLLVAILALIFWPKAPPSAAAETTWTEASSSPPAATTAVPFPPAPTYPVVPPVVPYSPAPVASAPPPSPPTAAASAAAVSARPSAPPNRCSPPYYFDRSGTKRFKKECF